MENHSWIQLQTTIRPLTEDVEISLPTKSIQDADDEHWFYPLLPFDGHRQPFPDASFVNTVYHQLDKSGFLAKKEDVDGGNKYKILGFQPELDKVFAYPSDWRFGYGRSTGASKYIEENNFFLEVIRQDIILHQNSKYYGPLKMCRYGCGNRTLMRDPVMLVEYCLAINWYDLEMIDPRTTMVKSETVNLCENCEGGEYFYFFAFF